MRILPVIISGIFLFPALAFRPKNKQKIDGAWKVVSTQVFKADGSQSTAYPKESEAIFAKGFYSFCWGVSVSEATSWQTPDSIKINRFNAMLVNTGTYEVKDSLLVMHAKFALVPMFVNGEASYSYHYSGDTMVLRGLDVRSNKQVSHPVYAGGGYIVTRLLRIN